MYEGGEGERYFFYKIVLAVIAWPNRRCGLFKLDVFKTYARYNFSLLRYYSSQGQ